MRESPAAIAAATEFVRKDVPRIPSEASPQTDEVYRHNMS